VLVIGGGNSGSDIAVECSRHAAATVHSTRRGYYVMPRFVFGRPATWPPLRETRSCSVTAAVDLMRKCAEVALEVRDMVEGNRLIREHFHNGAALQEVLENAFIGTFIVAKAPEAYLMNVSLALYADPGTTTCLKTMRAVIAEAKERAAGYLEESGLTVDPELDDDDEYGAFMQVGQLVTHAALMEQIRVGVALKPTVVTPRPVSLMEQIRAGVTLKPTVVNPRPVFPADPPPPIPVQIMVGEIVAPSPPDVRPALDRLEATLRRVAEEYKKTLSRYVFSSLRNTSPESMATYAYLTNRVAADIGRSKLDADIVSVPSIMRALLGGPPALDVARQDAARATSNRRSSTNSGCSSRRATCTASSEKRSGRGSRPTPTPTSSASSEPARGDARGSRAAHPRAMLAGPPLAVVYFATIS